MPAAKRLPLRTLFISLPCDAALGSLRGTVDERGTIEGSLDSLTPNDIAAASQEDGCIDGLVLASIARGQAFADLRVAGLAGKVTPD